QTLGLRPGWIPQCSRRRPEVPHRLPRSAAGCRRGGGRGWAPKTWRRSRHICAGTKASEARPHSGARPATEEAMSLLGRALLAFSHDVTAGSEPDWTEWHDREHIPERLSIPGFLRLRRYVAVGAGPRFFYFYETESLDVLQSPAY